MGQKRRAEARGVRQWDGDVAAANDLEEVRTWVVWGVGADPSEPERAAAPEDEEARGRPGNDVAGWAEDDERVRGYAPYLLQAADPDVEPMEGTLRNDKVVRRTGGERLDAGRPH